MCKHKRHEEYTCSEDEYMVCLAKIKIPDAEYEQVPNNEIEESPEHVDDRRGQAESGHTI